MEHNYGIYKLYWDYCINNNNNVDVIVCLEGDMFGFTNTFSVETIKNFNFQNVQIVVNQVLLTVQSVDEQGQYMELKLFYKDQNLVNNMLIQLEDEVSKQYNFDYKVFIKEIGGIESDYKIKFEKLLTINYLMIKNINDKTLIVKFKGINGITRRISITKNKYIGFVFQQNIKTDEISVYDMENNPINLGEYDFLITCKKL